MAVNGIAILAERLFTLSNITPGRSGLKYGVTQMDMFVGF